MKNLATLVFIFLFNMAFAQEAPTPDMVRQMISGEIKSMNIEPEKIYKIENKNIDGIPVRIYYPNAAKKLDVIYNIHGGALVAGDIETHENISRKIANATNSIVISLDYRKAPENPFPKSLDDVVTVYKWIIKNQQTISSKAKEMSIVSDSGGCLLAAALQIEVKQKNIDGKIKKVIYINPAFDLRNPGQGFYGIVTNWYLSGVNPNNELVSPILAKDFSVFSPCLIVVNEKDILLSQGVDFSTKLNAAKIKNELITIHGEDHFGGFWAAAHPKINLTFNKTIKFLVKK